MEWVRKIGLMDDFDKVYFFYNKIRYNNKNNRFKRNNPLVKLPPDYVLYEAYKMDFENYFNDGRSTASQIVSQLSPYIFLHNSRILE